MNSGGNSWLQGRGPLLVVTAVALVVRLGYLWYYSGLPEWAMLTVDNWYHHNWASVIAGGDIVGDTTYFRAPGYIWGLGLLYAITGPSLWVARIFGLLIGTASVYLTGRLGQQVFSTRAGVLAAALHSLYPVAIYFEQELLIDPLFTLLLQLTLLQFVHWWQAPSAAKFGLVGVLLGVSTLVRPTGLILVPVLLVAAVVHRESRARVSQIALFFVALLLVISPVTVRNVLVGGEPVLVAAQAGINLYIGNNDEADGKSAVLPQPYGHNWQLADVTYEAETAAGRDLTPGEVSSYWTDRAIDWMLANPGPFLKLYAAKLYYFFANGEPSNNRNLAAFFSKVPLLAYNPLSFGVLLTLAVLGVFRQWRRSALTRAFVLMIVVYVAVMAFFFVTARFRLPLLPIYFVLAGVGLNGLREWVTESKARALPIILLALILGLASLMNLFDTTRARPISLLAEGRYHFEAGDFERALISFRQAQQVNPVYAEVNLNIGAVFFRQGRADSAEIYFEREIAHHPGRVKGYTNLASLFLVSDRIEAARRTALAALEIRPFDQTAWTLLIRAYASSADSIRADLPTLSDRAATETGDNVYVLNEAAAALSTTGHLDAAERILQRAVDSRPPPVEVNDDAFTAAFATGPRAWSQEQGTSLYQLGYLAGMSGRFGQALDFTRAAIARDSTLVPAWINLVNAYRATNQPILADSLFQIALDRFGPEALRDFLPR